MENGHINPAFDEAMTNMEDGLVKMEDAVQRQLADIRAAFAEMDVEAARLVRKRDKELNELSRAEEDAITSVLAKYQPMAHDLRRAIGALKMVIEYERAGDYIKHLAKSVAKMGAHEETLQAYPTLGRLIAAVEDMFGKFLLARRGNDVTAATRVWLKDGMVDDLCAEAVREALDNQKKGAADVYSLLHSISVAKNLERIGDKIKNLVEIFYHQQTGEDLDIKIDD